MIRQLSSDRKRGLLLNGGAEVFLGASYIFDDTPLRQHQFRWLSDVGVQISWAGWVIAVCGAVTLVAALVAPPREALHRVGWMTATVPPLMLALLWGWTGVTLAITGHSASAWSPWTTVVVYGLWASAVDWMAGQPDTRATIGNVR